MMDRTHTSVERMDPPGVAPPLGRYTHIARVPAGTDTVYISGQVGNVADGTLAGDELYAQTRQALRNFGELVAQVGGAPGDIVKLLSFVVGAVGADLSGFHAARDEVFDAWFGAAAPPAHSLALVSGLAAPSLLVEIEGVVAVAPEQQPLPDAPGSAP